jgi:methyl-accepting chemotaxis protein
VAEEVRSLALRSEAAASKTEQLIRESVRQAENGATTAQGVAGRLHEIAGGVAQVSEIVSRIAADTAAQTGHFGELSRAIEQASGVTLSLGAVSEESTTTSERLSGEASELGTLVATFRVDSGETGPEAAPPGPAGAVSPLARA